MSSSILVSLTWMARASARVPSKTLTAASKSAMSALIVLRSAMTVEASRRVRGVVDVSGRRRVRRSGMVGVRYIFVA